MSNIPFHDLAQSQPFHVPTICPFIVEDFCKINENKRVRARARAVAMAVACDEKQSQ